MMFFEFSEFTYSSVFSLILGALFGGIYSSFNLFVEWVLSIIGIPRRIFLAVNFKALNVCSKNNIKSKVAIHFCDFSFVVIMGLCFILLTYIMLDGIFRLYMLIFFVFGFCFSKRTLGIFAKRILKKIFDFIYSFLIRVSYVLIFPLKFFSRIFIVPICKYIVCLSRKANSRGLLNKKIFRIKNSLKKINL